MTSCGRAVRRSDSLAACSAIRVRACAIALPPWRQQRTWASPAALRVATAAREDNALRRACGDNTNARRSASAGGSAFQRGWRPDMLRQQRVFARRARPAAFCEPEQTNPWTGRCRQLPRWRPSHGVTGVPVSSSDTKGWFAAKVTRSGRWSSSRRPLPKAAGTAAQECVRRFFWPRSFLVPATKAGASRSDDGSVSMNADRSSAGRLCGRSRRGRCAARAAGRAANHQAAFAGLLPVQRDAGHEPG